MHEKAHLVSRSRCPGPCASSPGRIASINGHQGRRHPGHRDPGFPRRRRRPEVHGRLQRNPVRATSRPPACFKLVPKTSLPTFVPQQPSDFQQPAPPPAAPARPRTQAGAGTGRAHQRRGPLDAGLVRPARPGQLPGLRLHRRAERGPGAAGLALRSEQGYSGQRPTDRQTLSGDRG